MRKVLYFVNEGNIYPVTLTTNGILNKLEIIVSGRESVTSISEGKSYKSDSILYSIIYNGVCRARHVFGNEDICNRILGVMTEEQKIDFLVRFNVPELEYADGSKLVENNTLQNRSGVTKTNGLKYKDVVDTKLVSNQHYLYSNTRIKTLAEFVAEKDLKLDTKDYKAITTYDELKKYVGAVDWSLIESTALDTETSGLKFFYDVEEPDVIVGMSHSYKDLQGVYIVFRYMGDLYLDPVVVFDMMKCTMLCKQVWQNGYFDYRVFRSLGIMHKFDCELTDAIQLLNPDHTALRALKPNARELLGEDTIELDEILGAKFDAKLVEYIPLDLMTVYACSDTDYTLRCFKKIRSMLDDQNKKLLEKNMDNFHVIAAANWFGFPSDRDYLSKLIEDAKSDKRMLETFILKYIRQEYSVRTAKTMLRNKGASDSIITTETIATIVENEEFQKIIDNGMIGTRHAYLDLNYAGDKLKILYTLLGYPRLRMTKSNKALSTGKDYFNDLMKYVEDVSVTRVTDSLFSVSKQTGEDEEILLDKNIINSLVFPVAYMFMQYAITENKLKTYKRIASNYHNGRSYMEYKTSQTTTGRITNGIQTIAGYAKTVIGHKPDSNWGLIVFDFDQIELRAAHNEGIALWEHMRMAPEVQNKPDSIVNKYDYTNLVSMFNNFESDIHTEMTSRFTKKPVDQISSALRKKYKETTFAGVYGGTEATMARKELVKAKTKQEREQILADYTQTRTSWMSTDLHLLNYFEVSKTIPLIPIPSEDIPFNFKHERVGMSRARSGRRRYYNLDNADAYDLSKISNQGRNQPLQGGCYDIYFSAITSLEKALRKEGLSDSEVRSIIFVHDEDGLEYYKTGINPLWLCAMIYTYCCIEVKDHPIKYYCTPAVVCNWAQGKSDKYEIPKGMLAKLSLNRADYEVLDNNNHDDYVLEHIREYYREEANSFLKSKVDGNGVVELRNINFVERFKFFKNAKMYRVGKTKVSGNEYIDSLLNLLYSVRNSVDYDITLDGKLIDLDTVVTIQSETEIDEWDKELFEEFDLDNFMSDTDKVDSIISTVGISDSVVDRKTLDELNSSNTNLDTIKKDYIPTNMICEEFTDRLIFLVGKNADGILNKDAFGKIDKLISEIDNGTGRFVYYFLDGENILTNHKLPFNFNVEKFDKFVTSLRA